jgi:hypothetical protein
MGMAEVVNPRVFRQADCLGSTTGWDPVVVPVELVDDSHALGRRVRKFRPSSAVLGPGETPNLDSLPATGELT